MENRLFPLLVLTFLIVGCKNDDQNSFVLNGNVKGTSPEYIYLHYGNVKDTALVIDNKFYFNGKVSFPTKAQFIISPASTLDRPFYLENTNMEVEITVDQKLYKGHEVNFIVLDTIIGTKTALLRAEFEDFERNHKLDGEWESILYRKLDNLIGEYPDHRYSGDLLAEISKQSILDYNQLKNLYQKLDTAKQDAVSMKLITKLLYPDTHISVGDNMLDFELLDRYGNRINTRTFRGSVLFIDFWASWCAPCRKQNPKFLKIYEKFKNEGFEILGVSIDSERERWLKAIKKDNITWQNVIEPEGYQSKILIQYGVVSAIPFNVLINKNGKVIALNITTEELEVFLKDKLKGTPAP